MVANRFTALVDACVLAGALKRNLLCSLAEAEFFQIRWSVPILDETEAAIAGILAARGAGDAQAQAARARHMLQTAFEDAMVLGHEDMMPLCEGRLADPDDAHVVAAALKTQAAVIVTDNLRDFPPAFLAELNLEARSADAFIADSMALDPGRAAAALRRMRLRFQRPALTAEELLVRMDAQGLRESVSVLREWAGVL